MTFPRVVASAILCSILAVTVVVGVFCGVAGYGRARGGDHSLKGTIPANPSTAPAAPGVVEPPLPLSQHASTARSQNLDASTKPAPGCAEGDRCSSIQELDFTIGDNPHGLCQPVPDDSSMCYIPKGNLTHSDAVEACEHEGLRLVEIRTADKRLQVRDICTQVVPPRGYDCTWLPLTCIEGSQDCQTNFDHWVYPNGDTLGSLAPGANGMEFSYDSSASIVGGREGENCAHFWAGKAQWAVQNCSDTRHYGALCETAEAEEETDTQDYSNNPHGHCRPIEGQENMCYIQKGGMNHENAMAACQWEGLQLVEIRTRDKRESIRDICQKVDPPNGYDCTWLPMKCDSWQRRDCQRRLDHWYFPSDGYSLDRLPEGAIGFEFSSNGYIVGGNEGEDCAHFWAGTAEWAVQSCADTRHYGALCEACSGKNCDLTTGRDQYWP